MRRAPVVVKVGGSLYDLPGLGGLLAAWLRALGRRDVILVPGGGAAADVVRDLDRRHGLGAEASHWLALRSLTFTAHVLGAILNPSLAAEVVDGLSGREDLWDRCIVPILDVHAFARSDEGRPGRLPHAWSVTSDSFAARVAVVAGADELILLKSVTVAGGTGWSEAARRGLVDPAFPDVVGSLTVRALNLREWRP